MFKKTDLSIRCSYKHKFRVPNDERSHGATSHSQTCCKQPGYHQPSKIHQEDTTRNDRDEIRRIVGSRKQYQDDCFLADKNSPFRSIIRVRPSFEMNASPKTYPAAYQGQWSTETSTHSISINLFQALRHANLVSW
jgi:hypothetical protein